MNISIKTITLLFFLNITAISIAQTNDNSIRQEVLKNNVTNKTFKFGKWTKSGKTETHLTYLGTVTQNKKTFKIMNSVWIWGTSKRATSRILIFNDKNKYYGNYGLSMVCEIPDKLEKGKLYFKYDSKDDCDCNAATIINLNNGFPDQIFIKCKDDLGDFYSLDKNN